jgi:ketosteroid isomerase-like protein
VDVEPDTRLTGVAREELAGLLPATRSCGRALTGASRLVTAESHREQPLFPARTFHGVGQVRANWSAMLDAIPDFHAEILRSAVDGDTIFVEIHWSGTKADGAPLEERQVLTMGTRDDRLAWGRLYVDEVEREGADIDAVVRRMAGTGDRQMYDRGRTVRAWEHGCGHAGAAIEFGAGRPPGGGVERQR